MLTNSEVLNKTYRYFLRRIQESGGKCQSGWGSAENPNMRCAIGSLIRVPCRDIADLRERLNNILPSHVDDRYSLVGHIQKFNDHHSPSKFPLTYDILDRKYRELAEKFGLEVEEIL